MFARINHVAIHNANWPMMARFYEAMFGMKVSGKSQPMSGMAVGDGYVGLNLNSQRDSYVGGLDHFGMIVDDIDAAMERASKKYPESCIVKRPSTRPFAAYSANDPDGNVFDLAQKNTSKLDSVYADQAAQTWTQERYLNKFALRTMNVNKVADFYMEVFELKPLNRPTSVPGQHLTDGRVMLSIMPWSVKLFEGMAIKRPGPDHIGFKVEDIGAFRRHVEEVVGGCSYLAPIPLGGARESDRRKAFFETNAAMGKYFMCDPGAVMIDITDEA